MREKARSDYGLRLFQARTKGGLTQTALAKAVGMSQSAYASAESTGQGSTYTSQLAAACGVSAEWLATGEGEMIPRFNPSTEARQETGEIEGALRVLAEAMKAADAETRAAVAPLFALLAQQPERLESVTSTLMRLIPERNLTARNLQDDRREGRKITAHFQSLANKEQEGAKRNIAQSRGRT